MKIILLLTICLNLNIYSQSISMTSNIDQNNIEWTVREDAFKHEERESLTLEEFQDKFVNEENLSTGILRCRENRFQRLESKNRAWIEYNFNEGLIAIKRPWQKNIEYAKFNEIVLHKTRPNGYWPDLSSRKKAHSTVYSIMGYTTSSKEYVRFYGSFFGVKTKSNTEKIGKIKANKLGYSTSTPSSYSSSSTNLNFCKQI
jgi:hypothetical protein